MRSADFQGRFIFCESYMHKMLEYIIIFQHYDPFVVITIK